ncbi:MAG: glycosyltransferase, partial [Rudaea sp.]
MQPPRVALVTNVLSHYRVSCFQELAARQDVCVDFFVLTGEMPHRKYVLATGEPRFPVRVLPGRAWRRPPSDDLHLNDPRPALTGYDVVILGGWAEPTFLALWSLALASRKRVGFWIESTLFEERRGGWKDSLKRMMLHRASVAIVPGSRSADYCAWLGMPRKRIFIAPNSIDVAYFRRQASALAPRRDALRAELGFSGVVILFVGRMVERFKSVSTLIRAFRQVAADSPETRLVLIGEGPDRVDYERLSSELGLDGIQFLNFMSHDDLVRYYAAADI